MRNLADELGINSYKTHLGCEGMYYIDQVRMISEFYSSQQNATLITEHQLMKEALEEMRQAFFEPGTVNEFWLRKHINDTLKQITL